MHQSETRSEEIYKIVIQKYPKSVKILRAYVRFLREIKNDPWKAQKYDLQADNYEQVRSVTSELKACLHCIQWLMLQKSVVALCTVQQSMLVGFGAVLSLHQFACQSRQCCSCAAGTNGGCKRSAVCCQYWSRGRPFQPSQRGQPRWRCHDY